MRNSEEKAWKSSWEEAWVVPKGEGWMNRAPEPSCDARGMSWLVEERTGGEKVRSLLPPTPGRSLWGLSGLSSPLQGRVALHGQGRVTWAGVWETLQHLLGWIGPKSF